LNDTNELQPEAEKQATKLLPLPDVGDLLFIGIMHILLFARPEYMFQDASIGWHLTAGQWILENKAIPKTDLFSYTFPDKAWVAYEWLFDLIAYVLTLLGGLNLLAVAIAATISFIFMKVYDRARAEGGPLELVLPVTIFGIFAAAIHWLARPHIITFFCLFYFLTKLEDFYRGTISSTKLYFFLGLLMVFWVNCHPAFPLGLVLIGIYFVAAALQSFKSTPDARNGNLNRAKVLFIAGLIACAATLVNPYGLDLYKYIIEYLKGSTVLANTDEFKSPVFHLQLKNIHSFFLLLLMPFFLGGLAITKKRPSLPYFTTCVLFLHMALSAVRNIPLFAIVSVPAIGLMFSKTILEDHVRPFTEAFPKSTSVEKFGRAFQEFAKQETLCKMHIVPIIYVSFVAIAALSGGGFGGSKILSSGFSTLEMPTKTLDYIREHKLPFDRGFNHDNWGGLIRYKLGQRVFIDDRADFYGEEFYNRYGAIVQTQPGWNKLLDESKIEWVLMPRNSKLAAALKADEQWQVACEDGATDPTMNVGSILFVRKKL
jgi:hypothetical protein